MKYNFTKLLYGDQIPKFQNPSGSITKTNVTFTSNAPGWYATVGKTYWNNILQDLNDKKVAQINEMQRRHYNLNRGNPVASEVEKNIDVAQYQKDIQTNYEYVNSLGITSGRNGNRYSYASKTDSNDNSTSKWYADGLYGAQTDDRRLLGREGDYTEEELTALNTQLGEKGYQLQLDPTTKYYMIAKKTVSANSGSLGNDGVTLLQGNKYDSGLNSDDNDDNDDVLEEKEEPLLPFSPPKRQPWTDWIPLTAQLGNDLSAIEKQAALAKAKKFPLMQGYHLNANVTDAYHQRTAMKQNAAELRNIGALRSNSSDLARNLENLHRYDTEATNIENQAEQLKAQEFARTTQNVIETENKNKQIRNTVANTNAQSSASEYNNMLNAETYRIAARNKAINSAIGNVTTSYQNALLTDKINRAGYISAYNEYLAARKQQQILKNYREITSDFTKSKAYKDFVEAVKNHEHGTEDLPGFSGNDYQNEEKIKELWSGDTDIAKKYRALYDKEVADARKDVYTDLQVIKAKTRLSDAQYPIQLSNQGFRSIDSQFYPAYQYLYKSGGSVKRTRFIDYLNHIQKAEQFNKKQQSEVNKQAAQQLKYDLDRLNKEQLILLRSCFK